MKRCFSLISVLLSLLVHAQQTDSLRLLASTNCEGKYIAHTVDPSGRVLVLRSKQDAGGVTYDRPNEGLVSQLLRYSSLDKQPEIVTICRPPQQALAMAADSSGNIIVALGRTIRDTVAKRLRYESEIRKYDASLKLLDSITVSGGMPVNMFITQTAYYFLVRQQDTLKFGAHRQPQDRPFYYYDNVAVVKTTTAFTVQWSASEPVEGMFQDGEGITVATDGTVGVFTNTCILRHADHHDAHVYYFSDGGKMQWHKQFTCAVSYGCLGCNMCHTIMFGKDNELLVSVSKSSGLLNWGAGDTLSHEPKYRGKHAEKKWPDFAEGQASGYSRATSQVLLGFLPSGKLRTGTDLGSRFSGCFFQLNGKTYLEDTFSASIPVYPYFKMKYRLSELDMAKLTVQEKVTGHGDLRMLPHGKNLYCIVLDYDYYNSRYFKIQEMQLPGGQ